jgi:hypothetical protein
MAECIAVAGAIVGLISSILTIGGAAFKIYDSQSEGVQSLKAFDRNLHEFIALWEQVQNRVDLRNPHISQSLRGAFLGLTERTHHDLEQAYKEFKQFYREEQRQRNADQSWGAPLIIFFRQSPKHQRVRRVRRFMRRGLIKAHQERLAMAMLGLSSWLNLML